MSPIEIEMPILCLIIFLSIIFGGIVGAVGFWLGARKVFKDGKIQGR